MRTQRRQCAPRTGFSFIEILFAIAVLGIGFIMIAAIFPVAVLQTQAAADESAARVVANNGINVLSALLRPEDVDTQQPDPPPRDAGTQFRPVSSDGTLWPFVRGSVISAADPRYAWVGFYRPLGPGLVEVIVIAVRSRNRSEYDPLVDLSPASDDATSIGAGTLEPKGVGVTLVDGGQSSPDVARFDGAAAAAVAEGCYLLIVNDGGEGEGAGRLYRVGVAVDAAKGAWSLLPGADMVSADEEVSGATALIVGRALADPRDPSRGFDGPAQDLLAVRAVLSGSR